jgi:hypothetical protein
MRVPGTIKRTCTAVAVRSCAALFVSLATPFIDAALAQFSDEAANQVQVGDRWVYSTKDEITGTTTRTYTATVSEITPAEIVTHLTFPGQGGSALVAFDHQWNRVVSGDWRFRPNDAHGIQFPLTVGKQWRSEYVSSNVRTGLNLKASNFSRVTAQEMVTSPAGTFETFKVERQVKEYNAADPSRITESQFTLWYAPQISHWVKRMIVTKIEKRTRSNETDEVVEFGRKQ